MPYRAAWPSCSRRQVVGLPAARRAGAVVVQCSAVQCRGGAGQVSQFTAAHVALWGAASSSVTALTGAECPAVMQQQHTQLPTAPA